MKDKIKNLVTRFMATVWKRPLPAINNDGLKYLANLQDTYYMYIREDNNGRPEYCINLVMLATLDYLCQIVLDNPPSIWPARYDFLINMHSNTRVYTVSEMNISEENRQYLEKSPGIFGTRFGALNVVCTYNETKRLDERGQSIEVFIIDKWPAIIYRMKEVFKECWWWGIRLIIVGIIAVLIIKSILYTV